MATITIIGTGLIGCSMGMRLRELNHFVVGIDSNNENLEKALNLGAIDAKSQSPDSYRGNQSTCLPARQVIQSSIVILAIPVDTSLEILPKVLDLLPEDGVVFDAGSTKMAICDRVRNHPRRSSFVAAHPMAGSEQSGPDAAKPNLFDGKRIAICEQELTDQNSLDKALEIFSQLGLEVIHISPNQHDATVALVSHLPQMVAFAFGSLPEFDDSTNQNWSDLASTGFDSLTRLSSSTPEVWLPIVAQNRSHIVSLLHSLSRNLDMLADSLSDKNPIPLRMKMEKALKTRAQFEAKKNKESKQVEIISLTK